MHDEACAASCMCVEVKNVTVYCDVCCVFSELCASVMGYAVYCVRCFVVVWLDVIVEARVMP